MYAVPLRRFALAAFLRLADASALPVFLYNMPACVKVSISQSTAERCTAHSNILGIKDMADTIPGHGGVLDRLDSLLVNSVVAWFLFGLTLGA